MGGGGDHKEKTIIMVLKVDLQCPCCYKKTKKILGKIPQVTNQLYDEKANTVTITVVCCSPERIRDKLCCKGGKTIKSIEIKELVKPKEPAKPQGKKPVKPPPNTPVAPVNTKGPETSGAVDTHLYGMPPPDRPPPLISTKGPETSGALDKPKDGRTTAMVATPWMSEPMMMMPPVQRYPQAAHGCGCGQCYYMGGPCYQYYGTPAPPQPAPYYGNYSYGYGPGPGPSSYGKGCCVSNDYFNDENAQGCTIM